MAQLKDTEFDDLFRRASDDYPLRTDSSDWDRMAAALEKDPPSDPNGNRDEDERRRRFFWLFLLLPLAGIGYYIWHSAGPGTGSAALRRESAVVTATAAHGNDSANKSTVAKPSSPNNPSPSNRLPDNATPDNASPNNPSSNNPSSDNPGAAGKDAAGKDAPSKVAADKDAANKIAVPADQSTSSANGPSPAASTGNPGHHNGNPIGADADAAYTHRRTAHYRTRSVNPASATNATDRANSTDAANATSSTNATDRANPTDRANKGIDAPIDPATNPVTAAFTLRSANIRQQPVRIAAAYALLVDVKAPAIKDIKVPAVKKDPAKPAQAKKRSSYFYAGLLAAPDISTVKFQSTKGLGTSFGILLGYAINPRWSVETGAYIDRKRYYTGGEYFNTNKVYWNPNWTLLNVDGTCFMWEIPLNVRYNFNPAGKTRWFATAGLSTYLMNREKYSYEYKYSTWTRESYWDLKSASHYPFSIVGLSAGFEQPIGKLGNLRVEPYVRLPLKDIGSGNLPIMSAGINVGITRRLW